MNIKIEQLPTQLKNALLPVYIVSGDEPLQVAETEDAIRARARELGFSERDVFHVETGFDWGSLYEAGNTLSLFATKRIIELRSPKLKIGDAGAKALRDYVQNPSDDNLLIITLPKLDAAAKKSKWFKEVEAAGALIQIWPLETQKLPAWINRRMRMNGLMSSPDAVQFLAEKVEGNMLAAAQEIDKLALLYQGEIDIDIMIDVVADSAKFDVFALVDAALQGNPVRVERVLGILKASGVEAILVQWALLREIRLLLDISKSQRDGMAVEPLLKRYHLWGNRAAAVRKALSHSNPKQWQSLICQSAHIDRVIKGMAPGNPWDELLKLSLAMSGKVLMRDIA